MRILSATASKKCMNKKARYDVVANVERWSRKQIRQTADEFWSYSVWGIGEAGRLPHAAWQSGVLAAWSGEGEGESAQCQCRGAASNGALLLPSPRRQVCIILLSTEHYVHVVDIN